MNHLLHRLTAPVLLEGPECGSRAVEHAAGVTGGTGWTVLAGGIALAILAWALHGPMRRALLSRPSPGLRLLAVAVAACLFVSLPLLSLHASHHAEAEAAQRCAVAGIADSVAGGVLMAVPALAPPQGNAPAPAPHTWRDVGRPVPHPIARGPPFRSATA